MLQELNKMEVTNNILLEQYQKIRGRLRHLVIKMLTSKGCFISLYRLLRKKLGIVHLNTGINWHYTIGAH